MNQRKNSLRNVAKYSIKPSSRRTFYSIVNKRDTHLGHSFLMSKFQVNMQCTAHFEMRTMSASSRPFSRQLSINISVIITLSGRPLRCSSWISFLAARMASFIFTTQYFIAIKIPNNVPFSEFKLQL